MGKIRIYDVKKREFGSPEFENVLRLQILVSTLEDRGIFVDFYNRNYNPEVFEQTEVIRRLYEEEGAKGFPCVTVDDAIVHKGSYPSNEKILCLTGDHVDIFDLASGPGEGGCGECNKCGGHC